ncbi:MAG: C4-dicarboxylate ABC transporter permease [Proteobacteria bacterium]|nr:MAG: C4-dicarboxylate ABC transporter permease [Pseudomonadota bacterium]
MKKFFYFIDIFVATINKNMAVVGLALGVTLVFINSFIRFSIDFTKYIADILASNISFLSDSIQSVGTYLVTNLTAINSSMTWAGELTNYLFIWSALFGAAYGFKKGIHISVTVMLNLLPKYLAKSLFVLANIISFIYLSANAYFGYQVVMLLDEIEEMSVDLEIPMWIPNLVLPIAFAGAAFRAGEKVIEVMQTDASKVLIRNEEEVVHDSVVKE